MGSLAQDIAKQLRALPRHDAPTLHGLRRVLSRRLAEEPAEVVIATALRLRTLPRVPGEKFIAFALVGDHPAAVRAIDADTLERLGAGLASWGDVDMFGCLLAGLAWRDGAIEDQDVRRWAASPDRWWRRAALVATVPLNVRAQGGRGDTRRTLAICRLLMRDRDDMVVKAVSWALRALIVHDEPAVEAFLEKYAEQLAPRVRREVRNKLATGLKNPASRRAR